MISYAQNFEDVMLRRALSDVDAGFYIDIGAQDPVLDSVSLSFYEAGWRGVHVEPTSNYAQKLMNARPDELVLQCAIGSDEGEITFFEFPNTGLSTGIRAIAERHQQEGRLVETTRVRVVSTANLLNRFADREVHWLKIDCEGMECDIVRGWRHSIVRPWIVVVESVEPGKLDESHQEWEPSLLALGYEFVYFDGLNRFYLSENQKHRRHSFAIGPNCFDDFLVSPVQFMFKAVAVEAAQERRNRRQSMSGLSVSSGDLEGRLATRMQSVLANVLDKLDGQDVRLDRIALRLGDIERSIVSDTEQTRSRIATEFASARFATQESLAVLSARIADIVTRSEDRLNASGANTQEALQKGMSTLSDLSDHLVAREDVISAALTQLVDQQLRIGGTVIEQQEMLHALAERLDSIDRVARDLRGSLDSTHEVMAGQRDDRELLSCRIDRRLQEVGQFVQDAVREMTRIAQTEVREKADSWEKGQEERYSHLREIIERVEMRVSECVRPPPALVPSDATRVLESQRRQWNERISQLQSELSVARAEIVAIKQSTSWRLTAPMRAVKTMVSKPAGTLRSLLNRLHITRPDATPRVENALELSAQERRAAQILTSLRER